MKFCKAIIYAMYLIVYAYAAHKTTIVPNENIWGYICVFIFGFLFTWTVAIVIKNSGKNSENKEENL